MCVVWKIAARLGCAALLAALTGCASLARETSAWSSDVNSTQRGVDWQMKVHDARTKLKSIYPKIKT